jgi:[ribosomal protein S18]-alanine N-acetyltransferase
MMEDGNLIIGEYEEGDMDDIIAIERDSYPTPWTVNIFRNGMTSPISRLLVGRISGGRENGVAGYVVYLDVVGEMHLHNIAVRRDLRRQGIATRLLNEAIRRSRLQGSRTATLEVRRSNLAAQRFYDTLGFSVGGVRRGYYTDTGDDALIMWADLAKLSPEETAAERGGD